MPSHHTKTGFQNTDPGSELKGFLDLLKWRFERSRSADREIDPRNFRIPVLKNDGEALRKNNPHLSLTWVGHATVYIQLDGKGVLTDPIWSKRASPFTFAGPERITPPGIDIDAIPYLHAVLISHNHYDHLDLPTLRSLDERFHPVFLTGLGNGALLRSAGIANVRELDWWQESGVGDLRFVFTPAQHFSARGMFDRNKTLWGSFLIRGSKTIYFAGDTGYFSGFREIAKRYPGIHTAILPIGAYAPRWFMKPVHMDPVESVQAMVDLNAHYMLPVHYHTFILTDENLDEPLQLTTESFVQHGLPSGRLLPLRIGESRFFKD